MSTSSCISFLFFLRHARKTIFEPTCASCTVGSYALQESFTLGNVPTHRLPKFSSDIEICLWSLNNRAACKLMSHYLDSAVD